MAGAEIAIRFVQYLTVLGLFGLTALPLHAGRDLPRPAVPRLLAAGLAPLALAATLAALAWLTLDLVGDLSGLRDVALGMVAGWAMLVRALALAALLVPALNRRPAAALILSGLAAASLAFGGHAAAGEGTVGLFRLAVDILHLLAAGLWLGALAGFLSQALAGPGPAAVQAMARFARTGSVVVAVLAASGLANAFWDTGGQASALSTAWALLLAGKLALVGLMLVLAAFNRWRLVPVLGAGSEADRRRLRLSLTAETALGVAVLLLVSLLGRLSPLPGG